ncbi:lamin tail domain-containing protein [Streptomyces sp. NPDC002574]|uniref:lamin tail domain-containing protein n=1 Tax=Streptomyces sp. NPDC002574 TaxID=3364652 RepID=UPI00367BC6B5
MRTRTTLTCLLTAISATAATLTLAAPAAEAASSVHLAKIYYDSPGVDRGSDASLNAEWVTITNSTSRAVSLKGWTLTDASNHKYTFGTYSLGAGKTVKVHTGPGRDTTGNRYQNRGWYVWNNDKDTATLRKAGGAKADTCSYNSTRSDYKNC